MIKVKKGLKLKQMGEKDITENGMKRARVHPEMGFKGSRINNFSFLALRFRLGLIDFKEQKAL